MERQFWTAGEYVVQMGVGPETLTCGEAVVPGIVKWPWAIGRGYDLNEPCDRWQLTHLPTGYALGDVNGFASVADAVLFVLAISELATGDGGQDKFDWAAVRSGDDVPAEVRAAVRRLAEVAA